MILGCSNEEIVKKAVEYQSSMTDGVVQYDYEDNKIFGAGFTTGTTENPENPFIEVFRLHQGEDGRIDCRCWESGDCPYWNDDIGVFGGFDEDKIVDGRDHKDCCMEAYADDGFEEDWETNFKNGVEEQVRDVLKDYIGKTLDKLDDIRIAIADTYGSANDYIQVRQDNWLMNEMDSYVDNAMEFGLVISESTPIEYVDGTIQYFVGYEYSDNEVLRKVASLVENGDLDGALELLQ